MTVTQKRTAGRISRAAARCAATRPACGYLHNAFGPGCPYCASTPHGTVPHSLTVPIDLIRAGFTRADRAAFLAAWDKSPADLTETELALLDRYDKAVAR